MLKTGSKIYILFRKMRCCACLSFVGHEVWRIMKFVVAALAFVGAIVTFFNVVCNVNVLREVVAAVLVVSALFMMIDSAGIEAVLNKFRLEISRLSSEVDRLEVVEKELTITNQNLRETAQELRTETSEYSKQNKIYADQNAQYVQQLQHGAAILAQERDTADKLKSEVTRLQDLNKTQTLQIQKLVLIEQNAQKMITSLMQVGDNFDQFGEIISKSAQEMEDTNAAMERLLKELAKDKFDDLDRNHDGFVTEQELEEYARRKERLKLMRAAKKVIDSK